jgi:hypothetical protein
LSRSIFTSIDDKLNEFAKRHNAKIDTCADGFDGNSTEDTGLRKIIWHEGIFLKAIFITPKSVYGNPSSTLWEFEIHASLVDNGDSPGEVPFWQKYLLEGVPFPDIERQIDFLLAESEKLLSAVKVEDMRLDWFYLDGKLVDNRVNKD